MNPEYNNPHHPKNEEPPPVTEKEMAKLVSNARKRMLATLLGAAAVSVVGIQFPKEISSVASSFLELKKNDEKIFHLLMGFFAYMALGVLILSYQAAKTFVRDKRFLELHKIAKTSPEKQLIMTSSDVQTDNFCKSPHIDGPDSAENLLAKLALEYFLKGAYVISLKEPQEESS